MSESTGGVSRVLASRGTVPGSDRWSVLMLRIASGDAGAISVLYDEANRYVYSIAMRILHEPEEAEEVALDVFQQVWRLAGSYNPERCSVTSWLAMMTRSRSLDRWRTLQARRRFFLSRQPETIQHVSPEDGPEAVLAATQQQNRLRQAMSLLPEEQRTMIGLAFWDGLSHSEVAARTGLPLGTVKTRIRLGMLKLKEKLEDADPGR